MGGKKSPVLAFILGFVFGGFGLMYVSVGQGFLALALIIVIGAMTGGVAAPLIWVGCGVWGAIAASSHNSSGGTTSEWAKAERSLPPDPVPRQAAPAPAPQQTAPAPQPALQSGPAKPQVVSQWKAPAGLGQGAAKAAALQPARPAVESPEPSGSFCHLCGAKLRPNAKFCSGCGGSMD